MRDEPVQPGRVLAGRYRLEERLGEGGMGSIWRAQHLVLESPVAVKILTRDVADSEETVARFLREAKAAASLRSTYVVQILDYGVDEDVPFIAMELLEGETLRQRIKRKGTLLPEEMVRIVADVCRAIGRAHEAGIVHRDLKPENIFLVQEDDSEIAKVLDFGVAKVSASTLGPDATKTRTGSLLGTPYYMSPEQAQGNKEVDHRSDLWSLAVIAFECLTGQRPFTSDALGDLVLAICVRDIPVPSERATVPAGFDEWFARAVERAPSQRFQSAKEMIEALRDCLGDEYALTIASRPEDGAGSDGREGPESEPEPTIDPRRRRAPTGADRTDTPTRASGPAPTPRSSPEGTAATPSRTGLDDTLLATPDLGGPPAAGAGQAEDDQPRSVLYLVGAGALLLGLAVGVWAVLSTRSPADRPLPDTGFEPAALDVTDAAPDGAAEDAGATPDVEPTRRSAHAGWEEADEAAPEDAGIVDARSEDVEVEAAPIEAGVESDAAGIGLGLDLDVDFDADAAVEPSEPLPPLPPLEPEEPLEPDELDPYPLPSVAPY